MISTRRIALAAGILFLATHVSSITARVLYLPVLSNPAYIDGGGQDSQVFLGVLLEVVLALTIVGTGVALYPVIKRQNEGVALGYVALRTLEAGVIAVGAIPLLTIVTLRQDLTDLAGTNTIPLVSALAAFNNWAFLIGPSLICGTNTALLAYLLYRSALVPRFIAVLGLIGGPLVFTSGIAQMFGAYEQVSVWAGVGAIPVFAWEICLAVYLIAKGFKPALQAGLNAQPAPAVKA
ncbi:DUF4386 domain-containing protein [Arthrobacter sp. R1-13]